MSSQKQRKRNRKKHYFLKLVVKFLGIVLVLIPCLLMLLLRWVDPPGSAFMLGYQLNVENNQPLQFTWKDREEIAAYAALAMIAAEDQKFPDHHGLDFQQIKIAISNKTKGKKLRGASTITQQTVKNLFLWQERSLIKKGLEAWLALLMEVFIDKNRILELYLNVAEFGKGIYGVEAASQVFFRKSSGLLSQNEAALLAAVLPNPRIYKVQNPSATVYKKQSWVLKQMWQLGGVALLDSLNP